MRDRWDADLAFEETRRRNGGRLAGEHIQRRAIVTLSLPASINEVTPDDRPMQRLVKALEKVPGVFGADLNSGSPYARPIVSAMYDEARTESVFQGEGDERVFVRHEAKPTNAEEGIEAVVAEWRAGRLVPPTVSVDLHKAMTEQGVALRPDGLFGYKLRCQRGECGNRVEGKCFAVLDPEEAVKNAATDRTDWSCSTACAILSFGVETWWEDLWDDMAAGVMGIQGGPDKDGRTLLGRICAKLGLRVVLGPLPDDVETRFPDGKPNEQKLHEQAPDLFVEFIAWFNENSDLDGDPGDEEPNEAACEA